MVSSPSASSPPLPIRYRLQRLLGHQHWIRRGRDRVLRLLCDPDEAPALAFAVPFFAGVYPGRLNNFIDWSAFHYGGYARHELLLLGDVAAALRRSESRAPSFFDVGANIGNHALFMALQGCAVFAFEPYAPVREELRRKFAANPGLSVRVFDFGLAERDALLRFRAPSGSNRGTGSFAEEGGPAELALPVRRGDAALMEIGSPKIDILKIDVEGFERQVLAGLARSISKDRPVILFELSQRTRESLGAPEALDGLLYPNRQLWSVETRSVSGPYRLRAFDFGSASEVLVVPAERRAALAATVAGL
jgi:FkbM family methyltransferase